MCRYSSVIYIFAIDVLVLNFAFKCVSANCELFEWRCDNGECIKYEDRCDGIKNCADGSDETTDHCIHFNCPAYAFRCAYGACIPSTFVCNKRNDCADGSDETKFLCDKSFRRSKVVDILKGNCSNYDLFECQPGDCIPIDKHCDGIVDCSNGADETVETCSSFTCPKLSFRCGYGACIAGIQKCDGVKNCADGSDETKELCYGEPINLCRMPMRRDYLEFFNVNGNKIINAGDVVDNGVELRFKCSHGWHLLGAKRIFCERYGWSNPVPFCTQYCSKYIVNRGISTTAQCFHNDQAIRCDGTIPVGAVAQQSCAPGYTFDQNAPLPLNQAMRCDSDGKWNADKLKCTPLCGLVKDTTAKKLPWEVSIFRLEGFVFQKQCMGTIISPKIVISAEKCFSQIPSPKPDEHEFYHIIPGDYAEGYEPQKSIHENIFNVSEIVLTSSLRSSDHIAILVLVKYFDFSQTLSPACVQFKRFTTSPYLQNPDDPVKNYVTTEFGAGFYIVKGNVYFLNAVVGDVSTWKLINITNYDSLIRKYTERYYGLL